MVQNWVFIGDDDDHYDDEIDDNDDDNNDRNKNHNEEDHKKDNHNTDDPNKNKVLWYLCYYSLTLRGWVVSSMQIFCLFWKVGYSENKLQIPTLSTPGILPKYGLIIFT